ncbi:hypothetical protein PPERSA_05190 [Pseudocohnilembus persalinus]|uniref:AMP-dependent synthetase/ligase domain-containing protein n=1 Tax=Pseudocohnilembus persalinus TaxID=266149 RepID=A0A0V0R9C6_PSEPJ|nr:hypothetical protein PPERSA_05190 [Pseudocohnilembus persalinus]|eukprot:KRX11081.1 hypothetical protein PPERSA_05190 [Pseudocohnilembus persalinus]
MGCSQSQQYSYGFSFNDQNQKKGESKTYRSHQSAANGLLDKPSPNINTLQDAWQETLKKHAKNDCLSARRKSDGKYEALSYEQVDQKAKELGSGILNLNLAPEINDYKDYKLKMVGIYAKNIPEWMILDVASYHYGFTVVPLYDTLGLDTISFCLKHSGVFNMFCQKAQLDKLLNEVDSYGSLTYIVAIDEITSEQRQKAKAKNIQLYSIEDVYQKGKQNIQPLARYSPEQIITFSYTSGTTGSPKGAMISHKNITSILASINNQDVARMRPGDIYFSYLPLPHIMDRIFCISTLYLGGTIAFFCGDILKLLEDLQEVKPTIMTVVPRIFNKFYDRIQQKFSEATGLKKQMIDTAISTKLKNLEQNGEYTHTLWDALIFNKIRDGIFGGRLRYIACGSAPIQDEILQFFRIAACCPVMIGYGQTETTGASFVSREEDTISGFVGGPLINTEYKVVDIPEMKYFSTDKGINGEDRPRGEICMRGPGIFPGYYKDEKQTKENLENDGWWHTGDVGEIHENGRLKIIDRKKNIFKLAQGEYVAPEKIENIYSKVPEVAEVFVHGDSLKSHLIGIVVPEKQVLLDHAKNNNIQGTFEELCQNSQIIKHILQKMNEQGKKDKLYGFEQVKAIYLETKPFMEIGCMTNTMKLQRHQAKTIFGQQIQKLYEQPLDQQQITKKN